MAGHTYPSRWHGPQMSTMSRPLDLNTMRSASDLGAMQGNPCTLTRGTEGGARSSFTGLSRTVGGVVKRRKHIVILGLDGSGKTTILMRLKYGCYVDTAPTIGFNHEKVWGGGYRWSAWDVGGSERLRPLWAAYARATDGLVFVIDASASADLIEEARIELTKVVKISKSTSQQLSIPTPPVLVLANFQDLPTARSPEVIAELLGLSESWASGVAWAIAPVCGLTGEGLDEAMAILRKYIDKSRQETRKKDKVTPPRWRW